MLSWLPQPLTFQHCHYNVRLPARIWRLGRKHLRMPSDSRLISLVTFEKPTTSLRVSEQERRKTGLQALPRTSTWLTSSPPLGCYPSRTTSKSTCVSSVTSTTGSRAQKNPVFTTYSAPVIKGQGYVVKGIPSDVNTSLHSLILGHS